MNFDCLSDTEDISSTEQGVILHEFGHTIGLVHEHQSPVRGGALTLKPERTSNRTIILHCSSLIYFLQQ